MPETQKAICNVRYESGLVQDLRLASPVGNQAQISAFLRQGKVAFNTIDSAGNVLLFTQGGETGWSSVHLPLPGPARLLTRGFAPLYGIPSSTDPSACVDCGDGWLYWPQTNCPSDRVPGYELLGRQTHLERTPVLQKFVSDGWPGVAPIVAVVAIDRSKYLLEVDPSNTPNFYVDADRGPYPYEWINDAALGVEASGNPLFFVAERMCDDTPILRGSPTTNSKDPSTAGLTPIFVREGFHDYVRLASAFRGDKKQSYLFGIDGYDLRLYRIVWDGGKVQDIPIETGHPLVEIQTATSAAGVVDLIGVTQQGGIVHVRETGAGSGEWSAPGFIHPEEGIAGFSVMRDASDALHVLAATASGRIVHLWQEPGITDWESELIEASGDALERFYSYQTIVKALDFDGNVVTDGEVSIHCVVPQILSINGERVHLDAKNPWTGRTNLFGEISLAVETVGLGTDILELRTPGSDPRAFRIDPAQEVKSQLEETTAERLLKATYASDEGSRSLLLGPNPDPNVAEALANLVQHAMALDKATLEGERGRAIGNTGFVEEGSYTHDPNRIDVPSIADQHWKLDFDGDNVRFSEFSPQQAQNVAAFWRKSLESVPPSLRIDWGDLWSTVKSGVKGLVVEVKELLVTTVVDVATKVVNEIKTLVKVLIEGVEYLYEGTLSYVKQIFDLVEEGFARSKVGINLLLRHFATVFDKDAISRTKRAFDHVLDVVGEFVKLEADYLAEQVGGWITDARSLVQKQAPDSSPAIWPKIREDANTAKAKGIASSASNLIFRLFKENVDGIRMNDIAVRTTTPADPIVSVWSGLADRWSASADWSASLQTIGTETSAALKDDFVGGIKSSSERMGYAALGDMSDAVAQTLQWGGANAASHQESLLAEMTVPILGPLVKVLWGSDLRMSPVDVVGYAAAAEVHIAYSSINGVAMFPDDTSLETFQRSLTAQAISDRLHGRSALRARDGSDSLELAAKILGSLGAAVQLFTAPFEAWLDSSKVFVEHIVDGVSHKFPRGLNVPDWCEKLLFAASFVNSRLSVSCILEYVADKGDATLVPVIQWCINLVFLLVDGACLVMGGHLVRFLSNGFGIVLSFVFGCIDFVLGIVILGLKIKRAADSNERKPMEVLSQMAVIAACLPRMAKTLRHQKVIIATDGGSIFVLAAIDLQCLGTSAIVQLVGQWWDPTVSIKPALA